MQVNSQEKQRRAAAYREARGMSWLELLRDPEQQRHSREFFASDADAEARRTAGR